MRFKRAVVVLSAVFGFMGSPAVRAESAPAPTLWEARIVGADGLPLQGETTYEGAVQVLGFSGSVTTSHGGKGQYHVD